MLAPAEHYKEPYQITPTSPHNYKCKLNLLCDLYSCAISNKTRIWVQQLETQGAQNKDIVFIISYSRERTPQWHIWPAPHKSIARVPMYICSLVYVHSLSAMKLPQWVPKTRPSVKHTKCQVSHVISPDTCAPTQGRPPRTQSGYVDVRISR